MAEYCHARLGRLKDDKQRDFVSDMFVITRRGSEPVAGAAGVSGKYLHPDRREDLTDGDVLEVRQALVDRGYVPIPVIGKKPPFNSWQKIENVSRAMLEAWDRNWPRASNTGILTKFTPTLDADILNEPAAIAIEDLVRERFEERGYILPRIGKAPKRAIPFRTADPFAKITANLIAADGSTGEKIEFLCDGQQVVPRRSGAAGTCRRRCRMNTHAARRRVFDLTAEMLFRARGEAEAIPLDQLERIVRDNGPVTGFAPWDPESNSATRIWAVIGPDDKLILYDHKTKIAHHWAPPDLSKLTAILKAWHAGGRA